MREVAAGSYNRQDYEVIRAVLPDDFEIIPSPEMNSLLASDSAVYSGKDEALGVLAEWIDGWQDFKVIPVEVIDLGDRRLLILNRATAQGAGSGLEVDQREAELWEFQPDRARMKQWWNWHEALEAVGLSE